MVLEASAPFTQLVRLTLGVRVDDASPSAAAIVRAAIPPPGYGGEGLEGACDDDSEALAAAGALASRARSAALAHRMRAEVPEVADWCAALPEAQAPNTVQLLCPKVRWEGLVAGFARPHGTVLDACLGCCLLAMQAQLACSRMRASAHHANLCGSCLGPACANTAAMQANVGRLYKALSVAAPRLGATLGPVKAAVRGASVLDSAPNAYHHSVLKSNGMRSDRTGMRCRGRRMGAHATATLSGHCLLPAAARPQISLDPMGHWPLCSALHSAAAAALDASGWAVLREGLAVERRLLDAPPGAHSTATLVEYDVGHQQPAGVLLFVKRAGAWAPRPGVAAGEGAPQLILSCLLWSWLWGGLSTGVDPASGAPAKWYPPAPRPPLQARSATAASRSPTRCPKSAARCRRPCSRPARGRLMTRRLWPTLPSCGRPPRCWRGGR